jgi:hypothetical protein
MNKVLQRLEEQTYKGDLELLDRYVGFSSEIVRVSLLGLAAIGFFLKEYLPKDALPDPPTLRDTWFFVLLGASAFALALAVAFGLLHRYYATDGLACHLKALRLSASDDAKERAHTGDEASAGTRRFRLSRRWLVSAEASVGCGVAILGVVFAVRFGVLNQDSRWWIAIASAASIATIALAVAISSWLKILIPRLAKQSTATEKAAGHS